MTAAGTPLSVGGHRLSLSNLDKVLYPSGFTKGRGDRVLPPRRAGDPAAPPRPRRHPQALPRRFGPAFLLREELPRPPPAVGRHRAASPGKSATSRPATVSSTTPRRLLWAANLAALELHVPLARAAAPDRPTAMVFDLDPGPPAEDCGLPPRGVAAARPAVGASGCEASPRRPAAKGLHVYVPLNTPGVTFDDTKSFARAVAEVFQRQSPRTVTAHMAKAGRAAKVFVDWSQNDRHKTTACAYTLRARDEPTVSTPLTWEEVARACGRRRGTSIGFTAARVLERVARLGDLFSPVLDLRQRLPRFDAGPRTS